VASGTILNEASLLAVPQLFLQSNTRVQQQGGDDQAVQYSVFTLGSPQQGCLTNTASLNSPANSALKILCQHAVLSAHSSAVKGLLVTVNITA
jgi:hypothetical protein